MPLAVEFAGVDFAYQHGQPVLRNVSLRIEAGEFVAVAGGSAPTRDRSP